MITIDRFSELMRLCESFFVEFLNQEQSFSDTIKDHVAQTGILNPTVTSKEREEMVSSIDQSFSTEQFEFLHSQAMKLRTVELEVIDLKFLIFGLKDEYANCSDPTKKNVLTKQLEGHANRLRQVVQRYNQMLSSDNGTIKDAIKFRQYRATVNAGIAINTLSGGYTPYSVPTREEILNDAYSDYLKYFEFAKERIDITKELGGDTKELKESFRAKVREYMNFMRVKSPSGLSNRRVIKAFEHDMLSGPDADKICSERKGKHSAKLDANKIRAFHDEINYQGINQETIIKISKERQALEDITRGKQAEERIEAQKVKLEDTIEAYAGVRSMIQQNIGMNSPQNTPRHVEKKTGNSQNIEI